MIDAPRRLAEAWQDLGYALGHALGFYRFLNWLADKLDAISDRIDP